MPCLPCPDGSPCGAPHRLWHRAPRGLTLILVAAITGGLWLDATFGRAGQYLTDAGVIALFAWLCGRGGVPERRVLLLCLGISALGEIALSLGWGLYDYQFGNVPLYVPPGHALLLTLGLLVAPCLTPRVVLAIAGAGAAWALQAWLNAGDEFGAALYLLFALCLAAGRNRQLYAAMFVLALAMELYGTALGTWAWRELVPGLELTQANPPFAAGAFYCLLDLLVLAARRRPAPLPLPAAVPVPVDEG